MANDKAREIALKFQSRQQLNRYEYGRNPLREEVVQSIKNSSGSEIGVVTRNLYGALVLNASNAMFIDIDFPDKGESGSLAGAMGKLLGNKAPSPEQVYVQNIEQWSQRNPQWGLRVYRTFGGLRCLITNEVFDPTRESSLDILRGLGSDALYIKLCRAQESFRARLTPKPWRCGAVTPPSRYPWENPRQEQNYREWEQRYQRAASKYTVCRLVKELGSAETHPDVAPILSAHDEMACTAGNLGLA
ncbi:MAG: hypothetical protein KGJ80_00310 [Chloroflexota bacterium]|nr:hypothetical protein [Chloroflexota bacterium]